MADINETHPYQVSIWAAGNGKENSLFEKGQWVEQARCRTQLRAEEVALCLSLRHAAGVQIAELTGDERGTRFVGYKFIPESARDNK
jgi:hypothetical protein